MAVGKPTEIAADAVVHRVGGSMISNLRLSRLDAQLNPPGISILLGGTPQEAAQQMRATFPRSAKWNRSQLVATSTVGEIRAAGFELVLDPTVRFTNHVRLIHRAGAAGFTDENLTILARAFQNTSGC